MKMLLLLALVSISTSALASGPQFLNLSKSDVENVSREFAATFSHTGVSAPETDGFGGLEVGFLGGQSSTPELSDVVERSGGEGSDFNNLYHAGYMVRAHFPLDLFAEVTYLPEQEISDLKIKNLTYEIGWNAGRFFHLPLDLAVGLNFANSDFSFKQDPVGSILTESTVSIDSKTRMLWVGVSRTFVFFTPYLKVGSVSSDSEVIGTASLFQFTASDKQETTNSGSYVALGANLQLFFFKLGLETSKIMKVSRTSAKLSLDF